MDRAVGEIFDRVKSWGRWGPTDEAGALNLITPEIVRAAAQRVEHGIVVSCGRDLATAPALDNPRPSQHMMILAGDCPEGSGVPCFEESMDYLGIACHGIGISHVDALCHVFVDGVMYNGVPASEVKSNGAMRNSIRSAANGIVGRAILLDVPRALGLPWLEPRFVITPEHLTAAEELARTQITTGDIVLVNTGRDARRDGVGPWVPSVEGLAGMDPACIEWFAERDIAVLGSDAISDVMPAWTGPGTWPFPIHQCCIVAMGLHLIDNLDLRALSRTCEELERYDFLLNVLPLRALRATGSPVNPVATF